MHKKKKHHVEGHMGHKKNDKVAGQTPDTHSVGGSIPDHKMFHKAKKAKMKKAKMKKAKMKKGRMKRRMLKGGMRKMLGKKKRNRIQGAQWHLIKKNNGECKCTQRVRGRLSIRKFGTLNECESQRNGC